jgi:hypothetical protein
MMLKLRRLLLGDYSILRRSEERRKWFMSWDCQMRSGSKSSAHSHFKELKRIGYNAKLQRNIDGTYGVYVGPPVKRKVVSAKKK